MKKIWRIRKVEGITINRPKRTKKYKGVILYESGKIQKVECLREFCDNANLSFRVLYATKNSQKFLTQGVSKGMRFESK